SGDGKKIGKVKELIVDPAEMRVRYLDIKINEGLEGVSDDRRMLVPIGVASLDEKDDNVFIKTMETVTILKYPQYSGGEITRDYETTVRQSLISDDEVIEESETPHRAVTDEDFYHHEHFDEERFYSTRRKRFLRLSELNVYDVIGTNPDVRGWNVLSEDGSIIGKVHEVLVDTRENKMRYLDVIRSGVTDRDYKHILIPIGLARLSESGENVYVNVENDLLLNWPVYNGGSVTRDYEYSVFRAIGKGESNQSGRREFYDHENYNPKEFYTSRFGRR